MTLQADGTGNCDRCGTGLEGAGVDRAVVVSALSQSGRIYSLHFCLPGTEDGDGCAGRLLTAASLAWFKDNVEPVGETIDFHNPGRYKSDA